MQQQPFPVFQDTGHQLTYYRCGTNVFNISSVNTFYKPIVHMGLAIKFVSEGTETYLLNKAAYTVQSGQYMVLNGHCDGYASVESAYNVKGICINIDHHLIREVTATLRRPDTAYADPSLSAFLESDQFIETRHRISDTVTGRLLGQLNKDILAGTLLPEQISKELFFSLAERLVEDQAQVYRQLQSIPSVKSATRRDLYTRLLRGKEYMDACFRQHCSIGLIARAAAMSEYHFFRLFKAAFRVTPHQYLVKKRLDAALALVQQGCSISQAAISCGFSDIFSFSKSFKKHFGCPPSALSKNSSI